MARKVLVTGMSGLIGGVLHRHLSRKYELSALNRRQLPEVDCHQADIADLDAILPAFEGKDAVVHLAALASASASWEEILHHNVIGTYNVFEASRRAGVKRVIFASSGATVSGWESTPPFKALVQEQSPTPLPSWNPLTHESPTRPSGLYGCSKIWGEVLARHFTDTSNLSILCVRIGAVNSLDRPRRAREFSVWCSQRDIAHMVECCLEAPDHLRYDIFFAVSSNRLSYRDTTHARKKVGFEPRDSADSH